MNQRKPDRRVARTQEMLADALIELILEKGYERISVKDIVDKANVGRTTFYAHFEDKEALLTFALGGIEAFIENADDLESVLDSMLAHAMEVSKLFRAFLVTEPLRNKMEGWLVDMLEGRWPEQGRAKAQFIAGGILSLLRWWQFEQPETAVSDILAILKMQTAVFDAPNPNER